MCVIIVLKTQPLYLLFGFFLFLVVTGSLTQIKQAAKMTVKAAATARLTATATATMMMMTAATTRAVQERVGVGGVCSDFRSAYTRLNRLILNTNTNNNTQPGTGQSANQLQVTLDNN